jgi:hypothetical protein
MALVHSIYTTWGRQNERGEPMEPIREPSAVLQHPPKLNLPLWELSPLVTAEGERRLDKRTWEEVCRQNTNMLVTLIKQSISWDFYWDMHLRRERGEVFYQSLAYMLYYWDEMWTKTRENVQGVKVFDNRDETILAMLAEDYLEGRIR